MLDIFKPENDKKRLIVLLVILVIVMVLSLVYKNLVLTSHSGTPVDVQSRNEQTGGTNEFPQADQTGTPDVQSTNTGVPMPPSVEEINKQIEEQKAKAPLPPTAEETKRLYEESKKENSSDPVTQ